MGGINHDRRQRTGLYRIPFRNFGGTAMPAYGVGVVSSFTTDGGTPCLIASVTEAYGSVGGAVGLLINGSQSVPANARGEGYFNVGPVPALYNTADGSPAEGETWGIPPSSTTWKLRKGYGGFTIASAITGGSSDTSRVMVVPEFRLPQRVVGYLRATSLLITNADTATRVIPFDQKGYVLGLWPSQTMTNGLELTTGSSARFTVRRSGYWKIDASWSSESPGRFSAPYQSKTQRVQIAVYVNGSTVQIEGGFADYYHFSLANADSSPTAGVGIRVPASITTGTYLASGDEVDLRVAISEVTADSGTTTEGYINFPQIDFMIQYVGPQLWMNDY